MPRLPKWRCVGKWTGSVTAAVCIAAWSFSGWKTLGWSWGTNTEMTTVGIDRGVLVLFRMHHPNFPFGSPPWPGQLTSASTSLSGEAAPSWHCRFNLERRLGPAGGMNTSLVVPVWAPLFAVTVPTVVLWYLERRRAPGSCRRCGYNLTGNTSGICPECGASTPPPRE